MRTIEFISNDGIRFELYINGERQEQVYDLVIRANVDEPIKLEIGRYALRK